LLQAFGCQLQKHEAELVDLLVDDIGKPIRYARDEVARAIALIDAAAAQIEPVQDRRPEKTGYRREPLGVIGLIGPFNNPLAIPIGKVVPFYFMETLSSGSQRFLARASHRKRQSFLLQQLTGRNSCKCFVVEKKPPAN
jgi:hypothetical protein